MSSLHASGFSPACTYIFLLSISSLPQAFSDLLLGVFCMPFTLVGSLLRDFIFGAVMCRLIPYFQGETRSVFFFSLSLSTLTQTKIIDGGLPRLNVLFCFKQPISFCFLSLSRTTLGHFSFRRLWISRLFWSVWLLYLLFRSSKLRSSSRFVRPEISSANF